MVQFGGGDVWDYGVDQQEKSLLIIYPQRQSITNLICCSHVFIKRLLSEKDEKFDISYNSDQSPKVSHNVTHNSDCKRT